MVPVTPVGRGRRSPVIPAKNVEAWVVLTRELPTNQRFSYLRVPTTAHERRENSYPATEFVILAEAGIQRGRVAPTTPKRFATRPPFSYLGVPAVAGMADCNGTDKSREHQSKIDPGRTLGQCQIPKATSELQFVRINS